MKQKTAFTLTEILLALAIVGVIAALVLPAMISKFNEKTLDLGFDREVKTILSAVDSLVVTENKKDFFSTIMYLNAEPESYTDSSGKFMKKYLKVSKYCGDSNGDCFANKYYEYKDKKKEEYILTYKGGCGRLKNGMSICIVPQIGAKGIEGLIDLNGAKGPNVLGRDLRSFTLAAKTRTGQVKDSTEVLAHKGYIELGNETEPPLPPEEPITPPSDPCKDDSSSLACCFTKTISGPTDACCAYDKIYNKVPICQVEQRNNISISCRKGYVQGSGMFMGTGVFSCRSGHSSGGNDYNVCIDGQCYSGTTFDYPYKFQFNGIDCSIQDCNYFAANVMVYYKGSLIYSGNSGNMLYQTFYLDCGKTDCKKN